MNQQEVGLQGAVGGSAGSWREPLPQPSLTGGTGGVSTSAAAGDEASGGEWQPQGGLREKLNSPTVFRKESVPVCPNLGMRVSVLLPLLPERS